MQFLVDLWMPIVLAAVLVFIASSITHMVLPYHKSDYRKLPHEDEILEGLRRHAPPPGDYVFPCPSSMKEMASPEMIARYEQGPVGFVTFYPNGVMAIGKSLAQWFVFSLLVGVFVAYISSLGVQAGDEYLKVFQISGATAFAIYGVSQVPHSIWKGLNWSVTAKFLFDGLIYGLVTAGSFAWLWPEK